MTTADEGPEVCDALRAAGICVESVYDLVNEDIDHVTAAPVLLEWLPRVQNAHIKEGIARALTFRGAGTQVCRALLVEFERYEADDPAKEMAKWAIGNAICEVASADQLSELIRLALDKSHGRTREMLVVGIGRIGRHAADQALTALRELLDDPSLQGHALLGLGYLRDERSRATIESFVGHEKAWVRTEATRALRKLKRATDSH